MTTLPTIKIKRTEDALKPVVEIEESRLIEATNDFFHKELQRKLSRGSDLADKAFFLPDDHDWILAKDSRGMLCLVPLAKPCCEKSDTPIEPLFGLDLVIPV